MLVDFKILLIILTSASLSIACLPFNFAIAAENIDKVNIDDQDKVAVISE